MSPNPVLQFNPTFRQLVNDVYHLVMEEAPDPEIALVHVEDIADDLGTSVYWVNLACDWLDEYGPFSDEEQKR